MRHVLRTLVVFGACLATAPSQATTVSLTGSNHDTTIFSGGTTNSLGAGVGMFVGTDANGALGVKRALVSFDVAHNVPSGSIIQTVTLTLTLGQVAGAGPTFTGGDTTPREIDLHKVTASWGEGTTGQGNPITLDGHGFAAGDGDATWADRAFSATTPLAWNTAGGDFSSTISGSQIIGNPHNNTTQFTWSGPGMVADVQSWLNSGDTNNFGWILVNTDETDSKTFRAFFTRESSTLQPSLTIIYVPEPTSLGMMVLGTLGFGAVAWRRKRIR